MNTIFNDEQLIYIKRCVDVKMNFRIGITTLPITNQEVIKCFNRRFCEGCKLQNTILCNGAFITLEYYNRCEKYLFDKYPEEFL